MVNIDEALMGTALLWAQRSHCNRNKVGAVFSQNGRVIAIGYNGTLPGEDNCCEDEHGDTKPTTRHAEENAMAHCLAHGVKTKGATVHLTLSPCEHCACMMVYAGIKKVVYLEKYRKTEGIDILISHSIKVVHLDNIKNL